jgi:hypothetical protein
VRHDRRPDRYSARRARARPISVRKLGQAAADARGEAYDPANNPAHAGLSPDHARDLATFDEEMASYQSAHRTGLAPAPAGNAADPPLTTFGPIGVTGPYRMCSVGRRLQNQLLTTPKH